MRLVRLGVMLGAAVLSAQATLQPLGLARVQTPSTAPATPTGLGQGQGRRGANPPGAPRPRREVLLIERGRIVAALPAKAVATPRQPRKLLIFNGSANHPSVPYADLAMQLMGEKTGAFTTTISGDPSVLRADSLKQYDAVYLNNNVGTQVDVFGTPELRQGFLDYVSNGGGLVASHGTSVASPNWKEFVPGVGPQQYDIQRFDAVAIEPAFGLVDVARSNLLPRALVRQVEDDAVAVAIVDRNPFGARRVRLHVPPRIDVSAMQ